MDVLGAMRDTLELARRHNLDQLSSDVPETDYPHLQSMYERALEDSSMTHGKLCRYLGWMQACVVNNSCGDASLENMKEINRRHACTRHTE